ncbi:DNA-binding protein [Comamonas terrae]|uniref:Helix-turn-helix domain-containing protein n=1 Tax=Comamonas terrae TaxID=673548 RepID=A0ABW5URJ1_9BURK|nr:DNA-binding protein [Comamonas terrae]
MDSLIAAAARALAAGDPFGALNRIALRSDAPALALRGIAMAQLGDLERARALVRSAARAFGAREAVARARCVVAEAEIALAQRNLGWPARRLDAARATLQARGDPVNAAHARYLEIRHCLLVGRLGEAERLLEGQQPALLPPMLRTVHELAVAGMAMRRLDTGAACTALAQAAQAAGSAGIAALEVEVERAAAALDAPAARLVQKAQAGRLLALGEVEALFASGTLVVDACRHAVRAGDVVVPLTGRPVLFALARLLAEAWPADVSRDALAARVFRAREADESYRARLRVELGRLRRLLRPLAGVRATAQGFVLVPRHQPVAVLARPVETAQGAVDGAVLALLSDGEAWASSALALAVGASQRSVQRALDALAAGGLAQPVGRGRARRWLSQPVPGFTTTLLLPAALPGG